MKLVRYGKLGKEKPGLIDAEGKLRSLAGKVKDISAATLSPQSLAKLAKIKPSTLPLVKGKQRFGQIVADTRKFVAIGLNYSDHAAEAGMPIPKEPIIFNKWITCLQGADDEVMLPKGSVKSDWECELGIVIGSKAQYVSKKDALNYVAGYCVVNDVSEREYQLERGPTWDRGKGCDTFGPVGPWLVTAEEVGNPQRLNMWMDLNGQRMQDGNTKTMIFDCATIVSYCSQFMTLEPGDIITTGTPPGVGMGKKPQSIFLKPGDVMTVGIEKLGVQTQKVVKYRAKK